MHSYLRMKQQCESSAVGKLRIGGSITTFGDLASHVGMDTPDGQCHKSNGGNIT